MNERQLIADVIRREVRLSAGIPEGQAFGCDWSRVAHAVVTETRASRSAVAVVIAGIIATFAPEGDCGTYAHSNLGRADSIIDGLMDAGYRVAKFPQEG